MRMKVFIEEKETEDVHLEELIEFHKKLEALQPKVSSVYNTLNIYIYFGLHNIFLFFVIFLRAWTRCI